jgi:hypothetical protein
LIHVPYGYVIAGRKKEKTHCNISDFSFHVCFFFLLPGAAFLLERWRRVAWREGMRRVVANQKKQNRKFALAQAKARGKESCFHKATLELHNT